MTTRPQARRRRVDVCGHRNPDTDSIASAIGYAELKNRLDADHEYVPVRLGVANAQTSWLLERSGAPLPVLLAHAKLRVRDVMRKEFAIANRRDPVRTVGLLMAPKDVVPIVDDDGVLRGVLTERALARRYIRDRARRRGWKRRRTSASIVSVLEGELVCGTAEQEVRGRVWVQAMTRLAEQRRGRRRRRRRRPPHSQERALPPASAARAEKRRSARSRTSPGWRMSGRRVVDSPLDSYVTSRMITPSEPVRAPPTTIR